ncbi:MAG: mycofactocin biosynthesis chaperone MftB [Desulfatitalea sp.]|nr:mycofactocin biosynthesis chaperone MftB [Desulfatitalea sp.]NNK01276.1 mycofactocin biosynthesis chaperone MftB [Desulfatitalea sp.]
MNRHHKYKLAPGTQVREENFGLLFYTYTGPRLFFMPCGNLLGTDFFLGRWSIGQWLDRHPESKNDNRLPGLPQSLAKLKDKGVILEC